MTYIKAEIRRRVIERAGNCCEYCLLSQDDVFFSFEIDHVIAEKHGGASDDNNLSLSCPDCNGFKGSDIASIDPETRQLAPLYNPRQQNWSDHFQLNAAVIVPLTIEGRVTVKMLRLNLPERVQDRQLLLDEQRYPCASASADRK